MFLSSGDKVTRLVHHGKSVDITNLDFSTRCLEGPLWYLCEQDGGTWTGQLCDVVICSWLAKCPCKEVDGLMFIQREGSSSESDTVLPLDLSCCCSMFLSMTWIKVQMTHLSHLLMTQIREAQWPRFTPESESKVTYRIGHILQDQPRAQVKVLHCLLESQLHLLQNN